MTESVTIRFSHVVAAGIVFYPRYFKLLTRVYPDSKLAGAPVVMRTEFFRANRLGHNKHDWCYSGRINDVEHFQISSLKDDKSAISVSLYEIEATAFRTNPDVVGAWAPDTRGHISVSRYLTCISGFRNAAGVQHVAT